MRLTVLWANTLIGLALVAGVGLAAGAGAVLISTAAITFPGVTLNGLDQTVTGSTTAWQADGEAGPGGWNLTVSSTDFSDGGTESIAVGNFEIRLLDSNIVRVSGSPKLPTSTQTTFAALSGTPLKIVSAALGDGKGVYNLTPDFQLTVPGETPPGNFTATVTVSVAIGP
ncbi:MAG: hypothetical protein IIA23_07200 [Chloroflexi bacterium]|nr:hypothetical protein [Chloroflexota bacterium]